MNPCIIGRIIRTLHSSVLCRRCRYHTAVVLLAVGLFASGARAQITLEPIGAPLWQPVDPHLFTAPIGTPGNGFAGFGETAFALLPEPNHQFHPDLFVGPGAPHAGPYTHEFADGLAATGFAERNIFQIAEFMIPRAVWLVWMTVPSAGAPVGASPDFDAGPILPNTIFPISVDNVSFRNGQPVADYTASFSVPALDANLNPPFAVDGHSHFPFFFAVAGNGLPHPHGSYEHHITMLDQTGNGWLITANFIVQPRPPGAGGNPNPPGPPVALSAPGPVFAAPDQSPGRAHAPVVVPDPEDLGTAVAALNSPGWPKVYMVTYQPGLDVDTTTDKLIAAHGVDALFRYHAALRGAAVLAPNPMAIARIAADPRVAVLRPDTLAYAAGGPSGGGGGPNGGGGGLPQPAQVIPAGIVRVGALETPNEGSGVVVAVLDTGIDLDHPDLAANIHPTLRADFIGDIITQQNPGNDGHGHGSHVAGIIGAVNNTIGVVGVASEVTLVPVRVLNKQASGTWAQVTAGVDYVTQHADQIKVANMSLSNCGGTGPGTSPDDGNCGFTNDDLLHQAICASVAAGVTYAVCGNCNGADDAALHVPAAYDEVITVSPYWHQPGSLLDTDGDGDVGFPIFGAFGADVDIAAPGVYVYSTWRNGQYQVDSGCSMATPHVAAAAAMYIKTHPNATPAQVRQQLIVHGENGYDGQGGLHPEPLLDVRGF